MHTYEQVANGGWVDSRSQSITLEFASHDCCGTDDWPAGNWDPLLDWGQQPGGNVVGVTESAQRLLDRPA